VGIVVNIKSKEFRNNYSKPLISIFIFGISFFADIFFISGIDGILNLKYILGFRDRYVYEYESFQIEIDKNVKAESREKIENVLLSMKLGDKRRFVISEDAEMVVKYRYLDKDPFSYLVPVTNSYSLLDELSKERIAEGGFYVMNEFEKSILSERYKEIGDITVVDDITIRLAEEEDVVAFIDVGDLDENVKLLSLEGNYFLDDAKGGIGYILSVNEVSNSLSSDIASKRLKQVFKSDFNLEDIVSVNMTGVTAITRNLASKVNKSGDWGYASNKIADFLKDADLTHISNEISFVPGCVPSQGMSFCSRPEYIESLIDSGVDIVELTGNHNNDYGAGYNASSIEKYKELGIGYFGGGVNIEDSEKILYREVKNSKIAFLGYNYYDTMLGTGALAGENRAGANSYTEEKLEENIKEAKENADVVVVDFQFQECYSYPEHRGLYPICYKPLSYPDQVSVFRKAVDFGADIVIGTQAHQPQTYEIYKGKQIFYGLGNLFFDQIYWIGTRQGLILTHYIHNGKLLQTRITTTYYEDDMQTYVTSGEKRDQLMELLRDAR